jgi:hypothetical protein
MNAEQLKIIAENSPREAAKILNIHIRNVRYHKQRMEGKSVKQLKQPKTNYKWTEEEDNYLLTFGNDSTYPELEETLKASRIQIDHRCKTLGVSPKKQTNYKKWTEEEDNYLLTFGNDSTYPELEETLKASRTQIDYRCKTLGVSPKKLKHHKILTEEEKEICLQGYLHQAAEKLGVSIPTAGRRRRELLKIDFRRCDTRTPVPLPPPTPTRSLINFVGFNDVKQPVEPTIESSIESSMESITDPVVEPTWTPKNDILLIKRISNNSIDKVAKLFGQPEEQAKERLRYILKEEKAKIGINEILSQFPEMTVGQIHQTKLIYSYSPKSAVRYCEVIREYAKNRAAYSPARIKNDR